MIFTTTKKLVNIELIVTMVYKNNFKVKLDRYCGSVYKFRDTPCSHYVKDGKRYLYFKVFLYDKRINKIAVIAVMLHMDVEFWKIIGCKMEFIRESKLKIIRIMIFGILKDYKVIFIGKKNLLEICLELISNQMIFKLMIFLVFKLILYYFRLILTIQY